MLLTKSSAPIIGWCATILGLIMNGIFMVQSMVGIENIGLCIILFTIVIYLLMTPLTIQQQKFSKLQAKMNPEIQAIQKKYKNKKNDQAAMMKMNEETQAVYAKYGVSTMGSCLQLVIQMPILFALYRVIWNIPAYVDKVKLPLSQLADAVITQTGAEEFLTEAAKTANVAFKEMTQLTTIDVLYKFKPANWAALAEKFPSLSETIDATKAQMDHMNYFLGLDIADSPMNIITGSFKAGAYGLLILAVLVPVLAALTQWLNAKLMTSMQSGNNAAADNGNDNMAQTMKTMNNVMPLMSAFFCLTLPVGMGLYWIIGAVVRCVQQLIINKQLDKIDVDELVKKNLEKINEKREKQGLPPQKATNNANISTRNIDVPVNKNYKKMASAVKSSEASDEPVSGTTVNAKAGSLAEKAMLVKKYNDTHKK